MNITTKELQNLIIEKLENADKKALLFILSFLNQNNGNIV